MIWISLAGSNHSQIRTTLRFGCICRMMDDPVNYFIILEKNMVRHSVVQGASDKERRTYHRLQCLRCMMFGMLLSGLRHASPRWLNLLDRVIGRDGGHFGKGTWIRLTCPGCSQWLVESDKRRTPLRSVPIGR